MKARRSLSKQLVIIIVISYILVTVTLELLIPVVLSPIYDQYIYESLQAPQNRIMNYTDKIMYINQKNGVINYSDNLEAIGLTPEEIINLATKECGKFKYEKQEYYYCVDQINNEKQIRITTGTHILEIERDVLRVIIPTTIIMFALSFGITITIIYFWNRRLVRKLELFKEEIDNMVNDNYEVDFIDNEYDITELDSVSAAFYRMMESIRSQEEYKSQVFQSISHDFKTPLAVIKSHLEALEDGMLSNKEFENVIKTQFGKLEFKVNSLLYLNKLNYLKDVEQFKNKNIDIQPIIESSVEKFKYQRPELNFKIKLIGNTIFRGNIDSWETIIDNLLNNFIRYAETEITITLRNNELKLYNDGPSIDENIFVDIFSPYKKGLKGLFGLGLSIVKRTLNMLEYDISVKNEKKGISFIIK